VGEYLDQIPENLKGHMGEIARGSGLPDGEETCEGIARAWLEKKASFEEQMRRLGMKEVDRVAARDERGFLVMTWSGSLIKVGPLVEASRRVEYASIGLRTNVPESAAAVSAALKDDVVAGRVVAFRHGPIRSSSPAFKIAVFTNPLGLAEQDEQLSLAARILTREFVEANAAVPRPRGGK